MPRDSETARGTIGPKVVQLSIFLENRVGLLLQVTKLLEEKNVHICAISIIDTADTAVVRMIVDNVPRAKTALKERGIAVYETDLLAVELPVREGMTFTGILGTLLRAEVNVHYVYSLITRSNGNPVLAFHVEDHDMAVEVLERHGLSLIGQDDIAWEGEEGV
jgi:hypothetical protein